MTTSVRIGRLPSALKKHGGTKLFTPETVPQALTRDHRTKGGVWGLICVEAGALDVTIEDQGPDAVTIGAGEKAVVEPTQTHRVHLHADAAFRIEFYSAPDGER